MDSIPQFVASAVAEIWYPNCKRRSRDVYSPRPYYLNLKIGILLSVLNLHSKFEVVVSVIPNIQEVTKFEK